jgi:hypothetical protein
MICLAYLSRPFKVSAFQLLEPGSGSQSMNVRAFGQIDHLLWMVIHLCDLEIKESVVRQKRMRITVQEPNPYGKQCI